MEQTFFIAHRLRQVEDTMRNSSRNIIIIIEKYIKNKSLCIFLLYHMLECAEGDA